MVKFIGSFLLWVTTHRPRESRFRTVEEPGADLVVYTTAASKLRSSFTFLPVAGLAPTVQANV